MSNPNPIRPSRTFESYSRGLSLVRAIHAMRDQNRNTRWTRVDGRWVPPSVAINSRIQALVVEYDLTVAEWHYWCRIATGEIRA
jgi:hypothetical protein